MEKPLILRCACGVETLDISVTVEDGLEEGYITFATWWDQHRSWRERFRVCWTILRGKSHYFDQAELTPEDVARLRAYLGVGPWTLTGYNDNPVLSSFTYSTVGD